MTELTFESTQKSTLQASTPGKGERMAGDGKARWARMMVRCPIWVHVPHTPHGLPAAEASPSVAMQAGQAMRCSPPLTSSPQPSSSVRSCDKKLIAGSSQLDEPPLPLLDVANIQNRKAQEIEAAAVPPGASASSAARARGGLWSPLGSPAGVSPHARRGGSGVLAPAAGTGLAGCMPSPDWSTGRLTPLVPSPDIRVLSPHRPPLGAPPAVSMGAGGAAGGVSSRLGSASPGGSGGGSSSGWTAGLSGLAFGGSPAAQGPGAAGGAQLWSAASAASSRRGSPRGEAFACSRSGGGGLWAEELEAAVSGAGDGQGQCVAEAVCALRDALQAHSAHQGGVACGIGETEGGKRADGEGNSEARGGLEEGERNGVEGEGGGERGAGDGAEADGSRSGNGEREDEEIGRVFRVDESASGAMDLCEGGRREESQGTAEQSGEGRRDMGGIEGRLNGVVQEEDVSGTVGDEPRGQGCSTEQEAGLKEGLDLVREMSRESSNTRIMLAEAGVTELLLLLLDDRIHPPHIVSTACLVTLNLALEPSLKCRLGEQGALVQLLGLLQSRDAGVCDAAVAAVSSLLAEESNRRMAARMGATGLLVEVVRDERKEARAHKDALIGLFNLSIDSHTREAVLLRQDLVQRVLALLADRQSAPAHMPAAALLAVMARVPAVCRVIDGNNGVPVLVEALEDGDAAMQTHVVAVLLQLALTITSTRKRIFQEGIIPSLVVHAEGLSGRARDKAMKLLALLRACEEQSRS